jgi:DNA-binding NarL/FixJ family response regulator
MGEPAAMRIFIVEDHPFMREMLCEVVERQLRCTVTGAVATAEEALALLVDADVDLVLVDVSLPQMDGIALVRALQQTHPELPCLMVSGHAEITYVTRALEAGARGYVLKGRPGDIEAGVAAIRAGVTYLSEPLRQRF